MLETTVGRLYIIHVYLVTVTVDSEWHWIVDACSDKEDVSLQSLIGHNIQEFCHASDVAQMHKHYAEGRFLLFFFNTLVDT